MPSDQASLPYRAGRVVSLPDTARNIAAVCLCSCNVPGCRHKNLIDHTHPDIPGAETLIFETQTAAGKGLSMEAVLRPGAAGMLEKLPTPSGEH